mgnify:CR=1 FL=1
MLENVDELQQFVERESGMDADKIGQAVHAAEHEYQPHITNLVVHGEVAWDGSNPDSLHLPADYQFLPVVE